eukprot:9491250-Pyramimonas_sp.AAC.1
MSRLGRAVLLQDEAQAPEHCPGPTQGPESPRSLSHAAHGRGELPTTLPLVAKDHGEGARVGLLGGLAGRHLLGHEHLRAALEHHDLAHGDPL